MQFTITLHLDADSYASVESRALDAFGTGAEILSIFRRPEPAASLAPISVPAAAEPEPEVKAAPKKAAPKKASPKKAAPKKATPKKADAPVVTEGALKKAVKAAVEATGLDAVRSVFAGFKGKDGEPCYKLSDVKPSDYAAVIQELG